MCEPQQKYEPHGRSLPGRLSGSELGCQKEVEDPALVEGDALLYQHAALPDDHSVTVSKETLSPRFKHTTDWQQVPSHCISHNVFGVDLMAIENYILGVVLLSAVSNTMLRENRVKRPTRCGCIVKRSSLSVVYRGSAVG